MSLGITTTQQRTLDAIMAFIAVHGAAPSLTTLAQAQGCNKSNTRAIIERLIERGRLSRMPDGSLAFGSGGVMVNVPREIAARLAEFCAANGEQVSAVVADAITLHIDDIQRAPETAGVGG